MQFSRLNFASKAVLSSVLAIFFSHQANAESDYSLRVGPARVSFDESASFNVGGGPLPGADATVSNRTTIAAELTYRLSDSLAAGLTVGFTPTSTVTGTGSLAPAGVLGKVTYAPAVATLQYRFSPVGVVKPYVGAGITYFLATDTKDGAVQQLKVDNKIGSALQAGLLYPLSPAMSMFVDIKKFYLKTTARGTVPALGGAPVSADVRLNPLVFHAGVAFDF